MNEFVFTSIRRVFACFLEEIEDSKKTFRNYLPFSLKRLSDKSVLKMVYNSPVSNIESNNSQNVGLEDYNNISVGIFPYFTTPSIKITLG